MQFTNFQNLTLMTKLLIQQKIWIIRPQISHGLHETLFANFLKKATILPYLYDVLAAY